MRCGVLFRILILDSMNILYARLSVTQQALFVRRLGLYLQAGVSLVSAFEFILEDAPDASVRRIFQKIERTISAGHSLSEGIALYPKIFNSFAIGFVRAGEVSGNLAESLERLAGYLNKHSILRSKLLGSLAYPTLVLGSTICIAGFLTLFIFPKIVPVLEGFRTKLPFSTRLLIWINTTVVHDGIWIFLGTLLLAIAAFISLRDARVRALVERGLLVIPIISGLRQSYYLATFARTLAIQLNSGIRILPALVLTKDAVSNSLYRNALIKIEKEIMEGQRFSIALRSHPRLFPPMVCQLISVGEATGTLSMNLFTIADFYEESLDEIAKNLTVLIEPILMIIMGFIVGFIALAIITPIYQVTQGLNTP